MKFLSCKSLVIWGLGGFLLTVGLYLGSTYKFILVHPERTIELDTLDLKLYGDFYRNDEHKSIEQALILIHSSNRLGRNLPFNTILSASLSGNLPVLNIDLRGFGDSVLGKKVERQEDLNFASDIRAWVEYIHQVYHVSYSHIILGGRGTGAAAVIQYMHAYPEMRHRIILICPPRGPKLNQELYESEYPFLRKRWERDMLSVQEIPIEVIRGLAENLRLESLPAIKHHRDILLIDTPKTMQTGDLLRVFGAIDNPKSIYIAEGNIDHYFGTRNLWSRLRARLYPRLPLLFYEQNDFDPILTSIRTFCKAGI